MMISTARKILPSPAGLTRGSMMRFSTPQRFMDCRVKPGNDAWRDCASLSFPALSAALVRLGHAREVFTPRGTVEVVEKFAEHVEMIAPGFDLGPQRAQHGVQCVHYLPPKCSLKRASSRTKSSKRRLAAVSSRSANQASADAELAHRNSARCARSPRSVKVWMRSGMELRGETIAALHRPVTRRRA